MKISDIAKKLGLQVKEVRDHAKELGFSIAQKSSTISDKSAKEFIDALQKKLGDVNIVEDLVAEPAKEVVNENIVYIEETISVKEFADKLELPVTRVITELMKNGVMASINENIDFETAEIVGEFLGTKVEREMVEKESGKTREDLSGKKKSTRPPVITIIGHVDHGKTKLLDYIRKTNVAETESGGITQHIGAYQIDKKGRKITFLDTPGHSAFSAMREHGVRITDVAVLVVAADDGVKPQTKESVNFAREAGVPIVVAINKIDKPEANIEKTKRELADIGLVPEDWGGNCVMGSISAKTGQGIDELLDLILLVADMKKIDCYLDVPANGFVIESRLSSGKGPVATVLIRDGVLKIGDSIIIGKNVYGKIRSMTDYKKKRVKEAHPSDPIRIDGLSSVPSFGDLLEVVGSINEAKSTIAKYQKEQFIKKINKNVLSLSSASSSVREGELKELRLIIKTDVAGSLKAIHDSLTNMKFEEVGIKIISDGVGDINDSDVRMAQASESMIIAFRVGVSQNAKKMSETLGVSIESFDIIYELIDKVTLSLSGLLESEMKEVEIGKGKVLKVFKDSKRDKILGIRVTSGKFEKGSIIKLMRNDDLVAEGRAINLKEESKNISEVSKGSEFGLNVVFDTEGEEKIRVLEGDEIIVYKKEEIIKKLISA